MAVAAASWAARAADETPVPTGAATDDSLATRVTGARLRHIVVDGIPFVVIDSVRIEHRATTVTGRVGRYDREAQHAVIDGDVRIEDGPTVITGDYGTFDVGSGVGTLIGRVVVTRDDLEIRAPRATYERSNRLARLRGGVTVKDRERSVAADSLVYWFAEDRAMAFGHVRIDQAGKQEATLGGEVAEYRRRTGELRLLEQAVLVLEDEGKPVTVTAGDFVFHEQSNVVMAKGNVVVRQDQVEATADNAVFHRDENRALLDGSPSLRDAHGEVSGDTLLLEFGGGELRRLAARGNARAVYKRGPAGSESEEMQLAGDDLAIELTDSEARTVSLSGHAESLYRPGSEGRESGAVRNAAKADRIQVTLSQGKAERVVLEGGAAGEYFYRPTGHDSAAAAAADSARAVADSARAALGLIIAAGDSTAAAAGPDTTAAAGPDTTAAARPDTVAIAPGDTLLADEPRDRILVPALSDSLIQTVRYQADRIELLVERDEILLEQHAELYHKDLHLTADKVRFSVKNRTLLATGAPVLADGDQKMKGAAMAYEFRDRKGAVRDGVTTFERGLYSGHELYKTGDGVFQVRGASYTTCDVTEPHYHFTGHEMKIYLDDKVVTRPVGLFIRNVPILALPYYIFPIRRGRHSGILMPQVEFGFSQTRGRFVRNAGYYYVINDYADMKMWGDFAEFAPYVIGNLDFRYAQRYRLSGDFATKFSFGQGERRWDVRGSHRHDLGNRRTLQANADFLSDREFRVDDQGRTSEDRFETQLRSNLTYAKSWSTQSARVTVERTQNLQNVAGATELGKGTIVGLFPAVSYTFQSRPIGRRPDAKGRGGRWPLLASTNYSFSGDYRRDFDSRRAGSDYLQTASGRASIGDGRRAGALNLTPSFSVSSSWDEYIELPPDTAGVVRRGPTDVFRGQYAAGLTMRTEVYGTFTPTLGPFNGFRHILTPTAALSYSQRFDSRSDVEGGAPSSSLALGLANRFETRLPAGEKLRVVRDFLTFNLGTNYDLSNRSQRRFTPIRIDARLRPGIGRDFEVSYNTTYDPYARRTTRYDMSARFNFTRSGRAAASAARAGGQPAGAGGEDDLLGAGSGGEPDTSGDLGGLGAGGAPSGGGALRAARAPTDLFPHAFVAGGTISFAGGGSATKTLQATFDTAFRLTPKWRVDYRLRYDLWDQEVVAQGFGLVRDLHCWEAQFRRSFDVGGWQYYFRIAIRDLPEIFYERGRESATLPGFF